MRMRLTLMCLALLLLFTAVALTQGPEQGQQQGPPPGGGMRGGGMHGGGGDMHARHMDNHDPLAGLMFPPEMILEHAEELNLTVEQKTAIRNEVKNSQGKFTDLQFQLQDQFQAFAKLLHTTDKTDERAALAALDQALDTERQIKRLHIGMVIRIKNLLTQEQIQKLMQTMHERMGPMHEKHPGGGGGPGDDDENE